VASPDTPVWVASHSDGALRFADNGHIGPGDTHVYHVLPTSATKAISVRRHLLQNAFEPARCLAIGDSAEDLEMASCVGAFALVRNGAEADPRLAARAKWITNASNGAGVLEAVTQWLEGTVVTR
jgi:hydroxymethylpyrimidine pyrophosphatase-like HAD family hydrolase